MAGTKFGDSFDPAFDVRVAEISKTAPVHQESADAADGGNVNVSAPVAQPGGADDPSTIEQIGGGLEDAAEDALLAAAAAAPPVAAAAAVVEQGEALLDAGKDAVDFAGDAADEVGGALDDVFGGDDDVPPGTSTFDVDPNDPGYVPGYLQPGSPEAVAAQQAAADAAERQADISAAKAGNVEDASAQMGGIYQDPRYEEVPDNTAHTQVDNSLDLESGIAGAGAAAATVAAPDGVFEPVSVSDAHTTVGAGDAGAPDGAFEPVSESDSHTSVGFVPTGAGDAGAPDGVFEPVGSSDPHTSVGGGGDAGAPNGAFEPVSASDSHTSAAGGAGDIGAPDGTFEPVSESGSHTSVGFVPVDPDELPSADHAPAEVPFGSDVQLNPQPIPPGMDGPKADVALNPQPIPPGMGADIQEPVADVGAAPAPSVTDSSIIIVGGTEAPTVDVADAPAEAPVIADVEVHDAPMEDVASTIDVETDGPSYGAADNHDTPLEVGIAEDTLDG